MTYCVTPAVVDAFYRAYCSRNPKLIGELVDDAVEWHVAGPVEVMQVCGRWLGKEAVVDRFARVVPPVIEFKRLDAESILIDGDQSALFGRITCIHRASGRLICHRVAHIVRYRNDKVTYFRCINDTLDAAEQFVGHQINLSDEPTSTCSEFSIV